MTPQMRGAKTSFRDLSMKESMPYTSLAWTFSESQLFSKLLLTLEHPPHLARLKKLNEEAFQRNLLSLNYMSALGNLLVDDHTN